MTTSDEILAERRKLTRVMREPETCWKCTDRKADSPIGLCPSCLKLLQH